MKRIKAVAFSLVLFNLMAVNVFAQEIREYSSFDEALKEAHANGKHLALYFYAEGWNVPAKLSEVLPDNRVVRQYLSNDYLIVNIDADTDAGKALSKKYNTLGIQHALALVDNQESSLGYMSLLDAGTEDYLSFFLNTDLLHDRRQYKGE